MLDNVVIIDQFFLKLHLKCGKTHGPGTEENVRYIGFDHTQNTC